MPRGTFMGFSFPAAARQLMPQQQHTRNAGVMKRMIAFLARHAGNVSKHHSLVVVSCPWVFCNMSLCSPPPSINDFARNEDDCYTMAMRTKRQVNDT